MCACMCSVVCSGVNVVLDVVDVVDVELMAGRWWCECG